MFDSGFFAIIEMIVILVCLGIIVFMSEEIKK